MIKLSEVDRIEWIRIHYVFLSFSEDVLEVIKNNPSMYLYGYSSTTYF